MAIKFLLLKTRYQCQTNRDSERKTDILQGNSLRGGGGQATKFSDRLKTFSKYFRDENANY